MKALLYTLLYLALSLSLPAQTLAYSLYSVPIWGHRRLVSEGTRQYSLLEIQSKIVNNHQEKYICLTRNYLLGAIVYHQPKIIGFHLLLNLGLNERSVNYFSKASDNVFCGPWLHGKPRTDYGGGKVRARLIKIKDQEELAEIEFLDDITLGANNEGSIFKNLLRMMPFGNDDTYEVTIRKGSRLCLQP